MSRTMVLVDTLVGIAFGWSLLSWAGGSPGAIGAGCACAAALGLVLALLSKTDPPQKDYGP